MLRIITSAFFGQTFQITAPDYTFVWGYRFGRARCWGAADGRQGLKAIDRNEEFI